MKKLKLNMRLKPFQKFKGSRKKLTLTFAMLFLTVISVWWIFYMLVSEYIYSSTKEQAIATSTRLVDELSREFATLERICYTLSENNNVKNFIAEKDLKNRLNLASNIEATLHGLNFTSNLTGNIIVIDKYKKFYRFEGNLSNSSCAMISKIVEEISLPNHIVVELENVNYIGYATYIKSNGKNSGAIVILEEENKYLETMSHYLPNNYLSIGIAADGEVISASSPDIISAYNDTKNQSSHISSVIVKKHIGITPFEVISSVDDLHLATSTFFFSFAAIFTFAIFVFVLVSFIRMLNKNFFSPILNIMGNIEKFETYNSEKMFPLTGSDEFDQLVIKINQMLLHIDKQNEDAKNSALMLKNAEITKEKALNISLKKQINAHFTINTLNIIKSLTEQNDYERARIMLNNLSYFIRYAYSKDEFICFWDEMITIKKYTDIMNVRYDDKIDLDFDVDDRLMDIKIPRMLVQPIVENSIFHGFKDKKSDYLITIAVSFNDEKIYIKITDNGCGMSEEALSNLKNIIYIDKIDEGIENIALSNIVSRLNSTYPGKSSLEIQSDLRIGTKVTITLPKLCKHN